jgi:hypothetical protein
MATYRAGHRTPLDEHQPPGLDRLDQPPRHASPDFRDGAAELVTRVQDTSRSPEVLSPTAVLPPPVSGPVVPGPEPVRYLVDQYYLADRGQVTGIGRVRQKVRHRAATIARVTLEAVAVTVLPLIVTAVLHRFPPEPGAAAHLPSLEGPLHRAVLLAIGVMWIRAGIKTTIALVQSLMYSVVFHERGFEVATGVLHRRRQFIWYYQLTEEPVYARTPVMFLTHTASLQVSYNHTANTVRNMELSGIGSPREVEQIRAYLETRRLAERSPMRGSLT